MRMMYYTDCETDCCGFFEQFHFLHIKALKADYLFLLILTLQHQFVNSIQKSLIVENNIWSRAIAQR